MIKEKREEGVGEWASSTTASDARERKRNSGTEPIAATETLPSETRFRRSTFVAASNERNYDSGSASPNGTSATGGCITTARPVLRSDLMPRRSAGLLAPLE